MTRARVFGIAFVVCASVAAPALAQSSTPLPLVVVDIRGAMVKLGPNVVAAGDFNVDPSSIRRTALAFSVGAHTYPIRKHGFAIGVGGEALFAQVTNSRALPALPTNNADGSGFQNVPVVRRQFTGASAIVSLNFGGRDGWSYISGGAGPMRFETSSSQVAHAPAPSRMTENLGGGVRWFTMAHLAAVFDVRFYLTRADPGTDLIAPRARQRVAVFSVGIAIR